MNILAARTVPWWQGMMKSVLRRVNGVKKVAVMPSLCMGTSRNSYRYVVVGWLRFVLHAMIMSRMLRSQVKFFWFRKTSSKWRPAPRRNTKIRTATFRRPNSAATMADHTSSIPVMRAPADMMSKGPNGANLAATARRVHPVDRMQRVTGSANPLDLDAIRRLYGSALAMRLSTERRLASQVGGRLPGMDAAPDSHAMLDALTGEDLSLDFGDILNLSENRPEDALRRATGGPVVEAGPHGAMETKLGL